MPYCDRCGQFLSPLNHWTNEVPLFEDAWVFNTDVRGLDVFVDDVEFKPVHVKCPPHLEEWENQGMSENLA